MEDIAWLSRTSLLIGETKVRKLTQKRVLVMGMGGVGSFAAEFIARAGIGHMTLIDGDKVDPTNRNRQLPALKSTEGKSKVMIMAERIKDINPSIELKTIDSFINPEMVESLFNEHYDYVVDAIDSITPKITFLSMAYTKQIPIVSSMGAGGKLDPTLLKVVDLFKTHHCPFAQQVRKELKKRGIHQGIKAVFSTELPDKNSILLTDGKNFKKSAYGTISYLPACFGAVAASVVIRDLLDHKKAH